jgi:putative addiction module component (TIGR02574 family)
MINVELKNTISRLNTEEKEELAQILWEDICDSKKEIKLSTEHREILAARLLEIEKGTAKKRSWGVVKKDILSNAL